MSQEKRGVYFFIIRDNFKLEYYTSVFICHMNTEICLDDIYLFK